MAHAQDSPNCSVAFHTLTANAHLSARWTLEACWHCHHAYGMPSCLVYKRGCVVCHTMSVSYCMSKLRYASSTHGSPHITAHNDNEAPWSLQELGMSPYPLLWLRYTTFIPLYPLGVASEMTMVALALPHIRKSQMWSIRMPNAFNFAFDYFLFCLLAVAIYIPGRCLVVMCIVIDISCQFALCMHAADLVVGGTCSLFSSVSLIVVQYKACFGATSIAHHQI